MEVGGSYYVIRELVQELEYNAKLASFNKVTRQPGKVEGSAQISDAAMSSAIVADEILKSSTMVKVSFYWKSLLYNFFQVWRMVCHNLYF